MFSADARDSKMAECSYPTMSVGVGPTQNAVSILSVNTFTVTIPQNLIGGLHLMDGNANLPLGEFVDMVVNREVGNPSSLLSCLAGTRLDMLYYLGIRELERFEEILSRMPALQVLATIRLFSLKCLGFAIAVFHPSMIALNAASRCRLLAYILDIDYPLATFLASLITIQQALTPCDGDLDERSGQPSRFAGRGRGRELRQQDQLVLGVSFLPPILISFIYSRDLTTTGPITFLADVFDPVNFLCDWEQVNHLRHGFDISRLFAQFLCKQVAIEKAGGLRRRIV